MRKILIKSRGLCRSISYRNTCITELKKYNRNKEKINQLCIHSPYPPKISTEAVKKIYIYISSDIMTHYFY